MNERQRLFAEEYLVDLNATKAAVRAGYSPKSAAANSARLLKNAEILGRIQRGMAQREKEVQITQKQVLEELAKIAFSNYADYAKIVVRQEERTVWNAEKEENERVLCDVKALEVRATGELNDEQQRAISGIKESKSGITVDVYDKMKALELLGKHLGLFKDRGEMPRNEQDQQSFARAIEEAYHKRMRILEKQEAAEGGQSE
ncbi:MAG: terminase small subunit [Oscillospiraceae bacterium]|nr:terminase small subunit [Oscillospiraceae bacterium]